MFSERDARMAMNYAAGMAVKTIAGQEGISHQRVYQILSKVVGRVMSYDQPQFLFMLGDVGLFVSRLRDRMAPDTYRFAPDTPEGFYHEMMMEPRVRNF
jgi:hypothetical protein